MAQNRETVSQLLNELANLIGVTSPIPTLSQTASGSRRHESTSLSEQPGPSTIQSNRFSLPARTELSQIMAPYPTSLHRGSTAYRLAGRPAGRLRTVNIRTDVQWLGRFYCLGSSTESFTPTESRMVALRQNGLGEAVISCSKIATSTQLKGKIEETFPKLVNTPIILMRARSGGRGKSLETISPTEALPSVPYLKASRVSLIYIKPERDILTDEEAGVHQTGDIEESNNESQVADAVAGHEDFQSNIENTDPFTFLPSLVEYRNDIYQENPGFQYIVISRGRILEKNFGVYKDPSFDYMKKPKVEFLGESGSDIG